MKIRTDFLPFGRPNFSEEEIAAVTRVLRSGWVGMGPETIAFEEELAVVLESPHVVTVNSCTSALFLSLLVAGVTRGDEVICPSFTWCSTANASLYLGARPVFCDIDPSSLCATPEAILRKLTPRTRAVIVVHYGGLAADVAAIRDVIPSKVALIEDAAHALGARYVNGHPVGSSGNLTCFSFYANKNLATGEGGAIAVESADMANRLRSLRQHALPLDAWKRFTHPKAILLSNQLTEVGYKANYNDLQAALGRVQLRRQPEFFSRRLATAQIYKDGLQRLRPSPRLQSDCTLPHHARHLFTVQFPFDKIKMSREEFILALRARNLGATIHYSPLHTMPLYRGRRPPPELPCTEKVARSIVTLPIGASMTAADARIVIRHITDVLA